MPRATLTPRRGGLWALALTLALANWRKAGRTSSSSASLLRPSTLRSRTGTDGTGCSMLSCGVCRASGLKRVAAMASKGKGRRYTQDASRQCKPGSMLTGIGVRARYRGPGVLGVTSSTLHLILLPAAQTSRTTRFGLCLLDPHFFLFFGVSPPPLPLAPPPFLANLDPPCPAVAASLPCFSVCICMFCFSCSLCAVRLSSCSFFPACLPAHLSCSGSLGVDYSCKAAAFRALWPSAAEAGGVAIKLILVRLQVRLEIFHCLTLRKRAKAVADCRVSRFLSAKWQICKKRCH